MAVTLVPASPAFAQADGNPTQRPRGVAVDVFTNVTGEPVDAWIGMGIAESLAADLGALSIGPRTRTRWHVRGAYQRLGTRIRITARLVDRATEQTVDGAKVDGDVSALFALEDTLAAQLTHALQRAQQASETRAADGHGAVESSVGARLNASTPRSDQSALAGVDASDTGTPDVTRGTSGFAMSRTAIFDGPAPPVPPAVAARDAQGRMTLRAVRLDTPLQLDGQLDERVYQTVPPVSDFVQQEPNEGAPATEKTEIWVMFDSNHVYVSFRAWESDPAQMIANEMRRDNSGVFRNANVAFILDTFYDRRNGVEFLVNPIGGRMDGQITDERLYNGDWNPIWDVEVGRFEGGWIAEALYRSSHFDTGVTRSRSGASTRAA